MDQWLALLVGLSFVVSAITSCTMLLLYDRWNYKSNWTIRLTQLKGRNTNA